MRDFAGQLKASIGPELRPALRQIGTHDPRITWYSDCRFPRLIDQLKLLEMQRGQRSRQREIEIYGREIAARLAGPELVLMVAARPDYILFRLEAPRRLREEGRPMPPVHLWLQSRVGPKMQQMVLFGNRPPPWPEPPLEPPSEVLGTSRPASAPGPVGDG